MSTPFEIQGKFKTLTEGNDSWYYGGGGVAWPDLASAKAGVTGAIRKGRTVGVIQNGVVVEYHWPDPNAITDNDLVIKIDQVFTAAEKARLASVNIQGVLDALATDTKQDISSLSVWDFDFGEWAEINAVGDKSISTVNIPNPGGGVMHFTQDATGGRLLRINGVSIDVIPDPMATTRVELTLINTRVVYVTSTGASVSGLVTLQQLATPVLVGGTATIVTVPLSWGGIANNAGYQIQRSLDNVVWVTLINSPANTLYYLVSPTSPGTTSYFRIRAKGDNANFIDSEWSNVVTKTTTGNSLMLLGDDFEDSKKDTTKWIYLDANGLLIETLGTLNFVASGGVIVGADYIGQSNSLASAAQFTDTFLALRFDLQMGVAEQFRIGLYTSGFGNYANGGLQLTTTGSLSNLVVSSYNIGPTAASSFTTAISNTDNVNRSYKLTINKTTQVGKAFVWTSGAWVQLGSDLVTYQNPDRICISVGRTGANVGSDKIDNIMLHNSDFSTLTP